MFTVQAFQTYLAVGKLPEELTEKNLEAGKTAYFSACVYSLFSTGFSHDHRERENTSIRN